MILAALPDTVLFKNPIVTRAITGMLKNPANLLNTMNNPPLPCCNNGAITIAMIAIIVPAILAILISFSVLFPGTVNSYITDLDTVLKTVTESGNIAVSQLKPLNASSLEVNNEISKIVDNFTNSIKGSLENTSFYSDYKGTINNIVDLMNQQAQPDISQEQIDQISNEIQTNTSNLMNEIITGIINSAVALITFNGLWILTDIVYGITAKILVNKNYQGA